MRGPLLYLAAICVTPLIIGCDSTADVPGRAEFEAACAQCHPLERSLEKKKDADGWTRTVKAMRAQGAKMDDRQEAAIIGYLTKVCPAK